MHLLATVSLATAAAASVSLPTTHLFKRQQAAVTCDDAESLDCAAHETQYYNQVCSPKNATGGRDYNAPCNAIAAITAECIYGADYTQILAGGDSDSDSSAALQGIDADEPTTLGNATQRACVCESQFFDQALGCATCYNSHGAPADLAGGIDAAFFSTISASYCAVTMTPTAGFAEYLYSFAEAGPSNTASSSSSASATGTGLIISDQIGNKTAVSYYFTPSVTGTGAWRVAQATQSVGNATNASSESLNTSGGQIMPTATGASGTSSGTVSGTVSGTASGTASAASASKTSSGAGRQEAAAVAGVVALAGFLAML